MQDFAGSTAVHLIGATGALAALLLLGPRKGKYGPDGKPRAIPGHSMPLVGLGILILFFGWFGFNPGSALGAGDVRFAEVAVVTLLGAAGGVHRRVRHHTGDAAHDRHRHGRQRHDRRPRRDHGALGLRRGVGRPDHRPRGRPDRGGGRHPDRRKIDDPVGALSAHGLAGIWGTLACGIFTAPRFAQYNAFGDPDGGLIYSGSFTQLATQAIGVVIAFSFVFAMSFVTFWAIKKTIGLRVTEEQEDGRPRHRRARHVRLPGAVHPGARDRRRLDRPGRARLVRAGGPATVSAMTPVEVTG